MQPTELSAVDLVTALRQGDITAVQCATAFLDRIEATNGTINAFLAVDRAGALARAADIDARRKAGKPLGALAGLPVALKDVLCTTDMPTTCASKMLQGFRPPYDADVVARLRKADAVFVGKTNMDEFAMGGSNENSALPMGSVAGPGRIERRLGGLRGGRHGARGDRLRHRRFDPAARRALRHHRTEANLRPRQPSRPGRLRIESRPDRPHGPQRRRLRPDHGDDRRP
jgi:aspartyl-tRNA(Asn)/glutamyl-tRNA(Gln) amidotransferase subunit A